MGVSHVWVNNTLVLDDMLHCKLCPKTVGLALLADNHLVISESDIHSNLTNESSLRK